MVYWELCSKYGFEPEKHWCEYKANEVMENQGTKVVWDFNNKTKCVIDARFLDIVISDRKNQEKFLIDVAISRNLHVRNKETEKTLKYQNLALEVSGM